MRRRKKKIDDSSAQVALEAKERTRLPDQNSNDNGTWSTIKGAH